MANEILTEAESSRIGWSARILGVEREELLRTVCKVKSFFSAKPALMTSVKAQISGGFDNEGKAANALFIMVKGAMAGASIYFSSGLAAGIASMLATVGITVSVPFLAIVIVVVALLVLIASLKELPGALQSMAQLDLNLG